jgi:hypothetical protein
MPEWAETCPHCGAKLPPNAKACPECGSDEQTGWSAAARNADLGLPDEEFDYEDFVKREFEPERHRPRGIHWFWWLVAVGVLAALLALWLR